MRGSDSASDGSFPFIWDEAKSKGGRFEEMKESTSLCDWRVMSRDSVEVIQPLINSQMQRFCKGVEQYLQARQSFRLISAFSRAFFPVTFALPEDGPAADVG